MGKRGRRGYGNRGRDQFNIEQVNGNVLLKPQETVRPNAEQNLLAEVRKWVQLRLEGQLHHAVRLNLQKETQPQQVRRPWGMEVKVAIAQPSQLLSPETTIKQVFDQCGERLLILGEPGAGKTTSLLDLALELVEKAENDPQQRIPVVVDLSDWQPTASQSNSRRSQGTSRLPGFSKKNLSESLPEKAPVWSIANWLAGKVRERYGFLPHQINQWLEEKRLIPLLDGLDEVRPEYQQDCVQAINQWLKSDLRPRQVALCCRREQYNTYTQKLELDGAVYLQDLTDEQIQTFLAETNRDELKESLVADENFLALIRRPLLLSMAVLAYKELDPTQWRRATSAGDRLNLLLDAYVRRMLTQDTPSRAYRQGKIPSPEQSQKWLEILALELLQESETEFLIEQIGTTWLSTPLQKWLFTFFAVIAWGLIVAVICWGLIGIVPVIFWALFSRLINLHRIGFSSRFWLGLVIGSLYGLKQGTDVLKDLPHIESVVGGIQISFSSLKRHKILRKLSYWKTILVPTQISLLINKLNELNIPTLDFTFNIPTLDFDFEEWRFKIKTLSVPNQGIKNLWRNAILITIIFVPLHILILCLVLPSTISLVKIVLISLPIAPLLWIVMGGGYVCINHFLVRLSLYRTNSISWDYARFLNYATERLLLQRVGGRYRFIHDLLRQSLAQRRIDTHPHLISSQVFFRCGESYRSMEQYDKALQNFDRAIELYPQYLAAIANRGETYRLMERYEEALEDFNRAIELNPQDEWAIASRSLTHRSMERYEEALQDFNRAIELNPKYEWAIANRGFTYHLMKRYEEALEDFNRAIELNPKYEWAIASRGLTHRSMERYEEALEDFNRAIELDPKYDWAIANRGITYRSMERYEEAVQDFNRAIELDPQYEWAIANRGITYRSMERYEEAVQDFNRAIELDPQYEWAIAVRGLTHRSMERYEEALEDFNHAIEINPQYKWAIADRGRTYCLMERYEEALQDFNAIELDPKDDWYRYLRSLIYLALQQAESAEADLNIAIQIAQQKYTEKPDNCQNTFNLALYHLVAGNLSTAQELYQTALEQTALQTQIRDAIQDLKDLLRVFPENTSAQEVKAVLEKKLKLH
ncbi:tetratricopeptide repeat protein [Nostoc edaphicum CCNP1411]|uniref:Tetratricopeptide repeat protein n=1 Tax=Nostoc edaphicum CCNP1411 TaxID=1472755 RepID=A0A7D7QIK6_9NOSO|nr:tetratricopeptide repeat protein [Nostoc edaphicum]QMS87841.1 tetratricopeptide repeat protein [Nostoc edaphicum CCNP1411]